MSERTIWFDPDEWPDASGLMLHGDKASLAGAEICISPAGERDSELARSLEDKGLRFIYEGEKPAFPFYGLPRLFVFATDEAGFYAADEPVDINSGATIFHIDAEGRVTRAAANLRALAEAVLSDELTRWETDHSHAIYASQEAAEQAGELFLRNRTPWRRVKRG